MAPAFQNIGTLYIINKIIENYYSNFFTVPDRMSNRGFNVFLNVHNIIEYRYTNNYNKLSTHNDSNYYLFCDKNCYHRSIGTVLSYQTMY